jgi:ABC-type branched-subunit amino acid transport system substrate-binding protein
MGRVTRSSMFALAAVLAVSASSPAGAADKLVIGSLDELTGSMSVVGPAMQKANTLAVAEANKAAEAAGLGWTVELASADTQGDPQAALSAARQLVDKGASCMIGPATTPESLAIANGLTIRQKIVLMPTGTSMRMRSVDDQGTIIRVVPPDSLQANALAEAAATRLGGAEGKTVSIGYRNEPYGEGLAKDFTTTWEAKGGKVRGPVVFDPNQATFDSEAASIVADNPDAYLIIDYPDSFVKMSAALMRTGSYDPSKLLVPDTISFSEVPDNINKAALEGSTGTRAGTPETTEAYAAFNEAWKAAGGADHFSLDANSFDATMLCFLSAVAAGSTDSAAILSKMREVASPPGEKYNFLQLTDAVKALMAGKDIDFEGVSGPLDIGPTGDTTASLYDIFTYKDGKLSVEQQMEVKK